MPARTTASRTTRYALGFRATLDTATAAAAAGLAEARLVLLAAWG